MIAEKKIDVKKILMKLRKNKRIEKINPFLFLKLLIIELLYLCAHL